MNWSNFSDTRTSTSHYECLRKNIKMWLMQNKCRPKKSLTRAEGKLTLIALVALAEDPDLIPGNHMVDHKYQGILSLLFDLHRHQAQTWCTYIHMLSLR